MTRSFAFTIFTVGILVCLLGVAAAAKNYALVLAGYDSSAPDGKTAFRRSAELVKTALTKKWIIEGAVPVIDARDAGSQASFDTALNALIQYKTGADTIIFHYIGHGVPNQMCPDFEGQTVCLFYSDLSMQFSKTKAGNVVVVLDACNSGSALQGFSPSIRVLASSSSGQSNVYSSDSPTAFSTFYAAAVVDGATGPEDAFRDIQLMTMAEQTAMASVSKLADFAYDENVLFFAAKTILGISSWYLFITPVMPEMRTPQGAPNLTLAGSASGGAASPPVVDPALQALMTAIRASLDPIEDACWAFQDWDERLYGLYGPPWDYAAIMSGNRRLLAKAEDVRDVLCASLSGTEPAELYRLYKLVRDGCSAFRRSPYVEHARLWSEGKIDEGNAAFAERNVAFGKMADGVNAVEDFFRTATLRAETFFGVDLPAFRIHPWSAYH